MAAITAPENLRQLASVSGRFLAFLALVGLSVPLSAELASTLPSLLPELGIREGQFGPFVNNYVLDVMANWFNVFADKVRYLLDTGGRFASPHLQSGHWLGRVGRPGRDVRVRHHS